MKRPILLLLWVCFALTKTKTGHAQSDSIGPQNFIDTLLSKLDTNLISSGLLADKTLSPFVDLDDYDGNQSTPITFDAILTIPFALNNMKLTSLSIANKEEIQEIYHQHNQHQLVVPIIMDFDYHKMKFNAIQSGLIDTSGYYWKDTVIGGVSPYEPKVLKTAALNYTHFSNQTFRFVYDPRLYLTNRPRPKKIQFDFDDGKGPQSIAAFDTVIVHYSSPGTRGIKVYLDVNGANEPVEILLESVTVKDDKPSADYADCRFMFNSDRTVLRYENQSLFSGYDVNGNTIITHAVVPVYMKSLVSIQLGRDKRDGTKHRCLKKPLIFVDGIDFGYENHVDEYFSWGNKCNTLGFENIARAKNINPITGEETNDLVFVNAPDFVKKATDAGYDIIFFDMLYGAADIGLNGKLLEEFIVSMNSNSLSGSNCYCGKSYDEIVILGASMGGQVSRYALLDMELNKVNHCVREWVSFDSPNEGANIALGLQHFVKWTADNNIHSFNNFKASIDNLERKLDRSASKQLLIYHHSEKYKSKAHPDYYSFYSQMTEMGSYPTKCRKVAIANGSLISTLQDFGTSHNVYSGGELLAELYLPLNVFTKLKSSFTAKIFAEDGSTLKASQCNSDLTSRFVFSAKREYYLINRLLPIGKISCENIRFQGLGFDFAPGGTNDGILALDQTVQISKWLSISPGIAYHSNFGFIPTVSALGIYPEVWQKKDGPLFNVVNNFGINAIKFHQPNYSISPFDAIYGPYTFEGNEPHVYISQGLIQWAIEDLQMGDYESHLTASSPAGSNYNFGNLNFNRLHSITVNTDCALKVFANDFIGYKNRHAGFEEQFYASVNKPMDKATFELFTTESCEPTHVVINAGGLFELGDGNERKTVTYFRKESKLELMEGATLHILNGSVLVIEKGAQFIYHKGAKIILDGGEAILQIAGEVIMPDADSKFTFSNSPGQRHGFIDFVNSPNITSANSNNVIELLGSGIASKIARVTGGPLQIRGSYRQAANGFVALIFKQGEVEIDKNSSLLSDAAISFSFINFKGEGAQINNLGVVLFGQPNISITNCRFQNFGTGLKVDETYNVGDMVIINHNLFSQCFAGASLSKLPITIGNSNFLHCTIGIIANQCAQLKIEFTSFSNNATGVQYNGASGLSAVVKGCDFRFNTTAVEEKNNNSSITIACSAFKNCNMAVYAEGNINLSRLKQDKDFLIAGGDCNFLNNSYYFAMQNGTIDLLNGNNNLVQGNSKIKTNFLYGDMLFNVTSPKSTSPSFLSVDNNFWSPNPFANPSTYNFNIITPTAIYKGTLLTNAIVGASYSNCSVVTNGNIWDIGTVGNSDGLLIGDLANIQDGNASDQPIYQGKLHESDVTLFPTPVDQLLNVEISGMNANELRSISITNMLGAKFHADFSILTGGKIKLNTSELENGVYFIKIQINDYEFRRELIVVHE